MPNPGEHNFHETLDVKSATVPNRGRVKFLTVKDWKEFQHYSKRNPPWIKLHRAVLDEYAFCALPDAAKGHLMLLWLYASQNNGRIPVDPLFLERKLFIANLDLDLLVKSGFLIPQADASIALARY